MEKAAPVAACESVSHDARRKFLSMAISTMLIDVGFDNIEKQCLETLCEMFQSCEYTIFFRISFGLGYRLYYSSY